MEAQNYQKWRYISHNLLKEPIFTFPRSINLKPCRPESWKMNSKFQNCYILCSPQFLSWFQRFQILDNTYHISCLWWLLYHFYLFQGNSLDYSTGKISCYLVKLSKLTQSFIRYGNILCKSLQNEPCLSSQLARYPYIGIFFRENLS